MIRADLHLHSCLSPCGGLDMSPASIVRKALETGLQTVALTDHNSCRNSLAMARVCAAAGLPCLHGLEACTVEEIHVLCLFDTLEPALALSDYIHARLPDIPCIREKMGEQVVVNEKDEVEEWEDRYLGSGAEITFTDLCHKVIGEGGLFIPSHIDRPAHSLLSQLGRVPELPYSAVEITPWYNLKTDPLKVAGRYPLVGNSDSHMLEQMGLRWTEYEGERVSVHAFRPLSIHTAP
jgi:PHP family Zn ribbon phosphoesterase